MSDLCTSTLPESVCPSLMAGRLTSEDLLTHFVPEERSMPMTHPRVASRSVRSRSWYCRTSALEGPWRACFM